MTLGPLMLDLAGPALAEEERHRLLRPEVGGVILFSRNVVDRAQLRALCGEIHGLRTPALLIAVDQEGGRVQRLREGFLGLPPLRWLGHQYDLDADTGRRLARTCGFLMASDVLDAGIDFSFAPVVDLDYGVSEVIGDRALHRRPEVVGELAQAYAGGMRLAGMVAVAKHFPGHGAVVADSHAELPVDTRPLEALADDLLPYEQLIAHGLAGIMAAHVVYPAVDAEVASLSPRWLRGELRQRLGFSGAIFSDDLSMGALSGSGTPAERALRALAAGADMLLLCNAPEAQPAVLEALQGHEDPARAARLPPLRGRAPADRRPLRERSEWREALTALEAAQAPPELDLHG
ncbi:MAG: beta-N-acetylhexosaminidase [Chromatiales bacterium]|nr:beta-N-acetylhexosaminidase [Chromatiales bacterium]